MMSRSARADSLHSKRRDRLRYSGRHRALRLSQWAQGTGLRGGFFPTCRCRRLIEDLRPSRQQFLKLLTSLKEARMLINDRRRVKGGSY